MLKMIIADDEPIIIRGIQKLIDWKSIGIEIVGEYEDGRKVFEGIMKLKPDLALLDISMPGMTGVDILKECGAMESKTQVIFISGFQDFEYAKAALKFGAIDYLLKPVIREELLNAVEKVLAKLPKERKREENFEKEDIEKKETDYVKLVEVEDTIYVPVYPEILFQTEKDPQMKKLIRFSFMSFLEDYLEKNKNGITFIKKENLVLVLKGMDRETCKQIVMELWEEAKIATGQPVAFIIGKQTTSMREIPEAFSECLQMKDYFFFIDQMQIPILMTGEPVYHKQVEPSRFAEVRELLIEAVIGLNIDAFEKKFRYFYKLVCWMSDGKKEDACFYFCNIIRQMDEKLRMLGLSPKGYDVKNLLEKGRNCVCYNELTEVYHNVLREYLVTIQVSLVSNDKKDILKAKAYIEKHYKDNLTLGVLAEEVHMNPYYFSTFFKKNAGENFKDYVNRVRLEHAVSLLLSTDKKTYEIAREVGFGDARSFTDAFQRIYHETPSAYHRRANNLSSYK